MAGVIILCPNESVRVSLVVLFAVVLVGSYQEGWSKPGKL